LFIAPKGLEPEALARAEKLVHVVRPFVDDV
jgi:hypothetical protein